MSSIETWVEQLGAPVGVVRDEARAKLVAAGAEALEPLLAALRNPRRESRVNAALCLGELGDSRAIEPLIDALREEPHQDSRPIYVRALADLAGPDAPRALKLALLDLLRDDDRFARALACTALGRIGDEDARQALAIAARDPEEWVRNAARRARADTAGPTPPAEEKKALVRRDQHQATSDPEVVALRSLDLDRQRQAQQALITRGLQALELVAPLLHDDLRATQRAAVEILGALPSRAALTALSDYLDACPEELRAAALHAIAASAELLGAEALDREVVLAELDHADPYVRAAAACCLLRAGGSLRRLGLAAVIDDEEDWVHEAGFRTLLRLATPADRGLRPLFIDAFAHVTSGTAQAAMLEALARILAGERQDDDAMIAGPASFFLEHEDRRVRRAALGLVLQVADAPDAKLIAAVIAALDQEPELAQTVAAELPRLARPGDGTLVPLLSRLLRGGVDGRAREAVTTALARIQTVGAVDALIELANGVGSGAAAAGAALATLDPEGEVIASRDADSRWWRELRPRCTCCQGPLEWGDHEGRELLRCGSCAAEHVLNAQGRPLAADKAPFGLCLCCRRKQLLVRGGRGDALVCPQSGETHIRPYDFPQQMRLLSDLPLGACECCAEPQPLLRLGDKVVCHRTRREHQPTERGFSLAPPAADQVSIDAINQALLDGTLGIAESGVPVARGEDDD